MQMPLVRIATCGGLACALAILTLPSYVKAQSEFIKWQTENIRRNLAREKARIAPLKKAIRLSEQASRSREREAQNMAVRANTAYLSAQAIDHLTPTDRDFFEKAAGKTVDYLSEELKRRAKTVLTGSAAKAATSFSAAGPAGMVALEALGHVGKVVDYRSSMAYFHELKRIQTTHEAFGVSAASLAADRRAELVESKARIAALERALEQGEANTGEIKSPKGVRIHFDDNILARALGRVGDKTTDADFTKIRQALYAGASPDQIGAVYRAATNNEKARFIRETKKTITVRDAVLVSLNAVARNAGNFSAKDAIQLGGVARIYGFVLVPETRDVVLIGGVERGVPPIGLDNLATALKTVWKNGVVPTVSLEPDPQSEFTPQRVRVTGVPKNSRFARIMLDADYLYKRITIGDPTLSPKFPSLRWPVRDAWERGWLSPEQPDVGEIQISSDENVVLFETSVRALSEDMQWTGRLLTGTGRTDPATEKITESITKRYRELERHWPVFRQLHGLFDLVMLSKLLSQLRIDAQVLAKLSELPHTTHHVPDSYPTINFVFQDQGKIWQSYGGVDTNFYAGYRHRLHYDTETMAQLRKKAVALSRSDRIAALAKDITLTLVVPSGRARYFAEGMETLANGQYGTADGWFTRVINEDPFFSEAYVQRAQARYNLGKLREAASDLDRANELLPGETMLQVMRHVLLIEMGQKPSQITMDAHTKRELSNLMLRQAKFEFRNGDRDASLRTLNLALKFNSKDADSSALRASVRLSLGDTQGAFDDAGVAIELEPDFAQPYTTRGIASLALGSKDEDFYDDAFDDFSMAIELQPEVPEWWFNRAKVYQVWGNRIEASSDMYKGYQVAVDRYTKLIQDQPDNALLYVQRGQKKMDIGKMKGAVEDFTSAIDKNPNMALAYAERAHALHSRDRYQKAVADGSKAIELDPKLARGYTARCAALHKLGRNDTALSDCNAAIRIDPNLGYAYLIRGLIRQAKGDRMGAIRDWKEAQRVDPAESGLYQQLIDSAQ